MRVRPRSLNAGIAWLFMIGSSCFAVGATPGYASAVGTVADLVTFFVGSLFFTSASYCQLLQAQSPAMAPGAADVDSQGMRAPIRFWAWLPHERGWLAAATQFPGTLAFNVTTSAALVTGLTVAEQDRQVWRPDFVGSVLFLVASTFAILALSAGRRLWDVREWEWWIAWLNMIGSIAFMASAIASFVLPSSGDYISVAVSDAGTFVGAVCFFLGAALMLPAWRAAVRAP